MSSDDTFRDGMVADIEQMDQVIGQFLDFARSGEDGAVATEPVDGAALLADVAAHQADLGREVAVECSQAVAPFAGRPASLRRALDNLIENAFKYGGANPQVSLHLGQAEGRVIVDVCDRGPGIPPDEAERLKQPFTRRDDARGSADGSVDATQGGSGLGLAIVERIARQHAGDLQLLPRDGGGLCARLRLARGGHPGSGAGGPRATV
jgi:two-component system osmolarity sensor histidine kinase EnvZ